MKSLFSTAKACLEEDKLDNKIQLSVDAVKRCRQDYSLAAMKVWTEPEIGRPVKPELVAPVALPRRGFGSRKAIFSLLHAVAHIEFNAINLAWDAIYRFQDMPGQYYWDWMRVAEEETRHFMLLRQHLNEGNYEYGDFDAHEGLWTMARSTAHDVLHRMAIIPRVLEARGLDVTPAMIKKFESIGETEIAATLKIIYNEEIGHVRIGNNWFQALCRERGLEAENTFINLVKLYQLDGFKGMINKPARIEAGFSERELDKLENEFLKA